MIINFIPSHDLSDKNRFISVLRIFSIQSYMFMYDEIIRNPGSIGSLRDVTHFMGYILRLTSYIYVRQLYSFRIENLGVMIAICKLVKTPHLCSFL